MIITYLHQTLCHTLLHCGQWGALEVIKKEIMRLSLRMKSWEQGILGGQVGEGKIHKCDFRYYVVLANTQGGRELAGVRGCFELTDHYIGGFGFQLDSDPASCAR